MKTSTKAVIGIAGLGAAFVAWKKLGGGAKASTQTTVTAPKPVAQVGTKPATKAAGVGKAAVK